MAAPKSFVSFIGGLLEGISISNIFFGISVAQFYIYTQNWRKDPRWLKLIAVLVMSLEFIAIIFLQRMQFFYSILALGDTELLGRVDWSIPLSMTAQIITGMIVQGFYVHRTWKFTRNIPLTTGIVLFLFARYALYLDEIINSYRHGTWGGLGKVAGFKVVLLADFSLAIFTDVLLASIMIYYLYRRRTSVSSTTGIINGLILYFVSSGGLLVVISVGSLLSYVVDPGSLMYTGFVMAYARALANSFFGALNAREFLRTKHESIPISVGNSNSALQFHTMQIRIDQNTLTTEDSHVKEHTIVPISL